MLWPIAFPDDPEDQASSLGDVFDCALAQSSSRVRETLKGCLRVDHTVLPDFYFSWFSVPWARAYTLNIDDLAVAADRSLDLPRQVHVVSAADPVPTPSGELVYVHLNGQLKDFPDITFSAQQYGRRLPGRDPWHSTLVSDLGPKPSGRELRPRSFLVAPELPIARQQMLRRFNIEYIPMDARQFAEDVLVHLHDAIATGQDRVSGALMRRRRGLVIPNVAELRRENPDIHLGQFLLGREPTFRDVSDGFAIQRSFEEKILSDVSMLEPRVILLTGTAGTGKSTALRRLALGLDAAGKKVGWCDPTTAEVGIPSLRNAITNSGYDYVVVDDVDLFAAQAGPLLQSLARTLDGPRIITAARSTRAERLNLKEELESVDASFVVAPPLTDSDIAELIKTLRSAGLLGQLAGKTLAEQRHVFEGLAGRQLLVAMIEATSGQQFNEKIDDECSQLAPEQRLLYAICALATRSRIGLELDEILAATGESSAAELQRVDALKRQHLLITTSDGRLAVRHRVVAEQVVSWLQRQRQLAQPVEGLLFAMAVKYLRERDSGSRAFRLMVRLLNHQFMIEQIDDAAAVRGIYESLSGVLTDDFHYWLQRGSFEIERGSLDLAENYLNQARGLRGNDHRVRTAWGYMSLRRAAELAQSGGSGWRERADEAMVELNDVIESRYAADSHPFHILGSQGLHYVRRAPLSFDEKLRLLDSLRATVKRGVSRHQDSNELKQLRDDLEKEYLLLAVPPQDESSGEPSMDD